MDFLTPFSSKIFMTIMMLYSDYDGDDNYDDDYNEKATNLTSA